MRSLIDFLGIQKGVNLKIAQLPSPHLVYSIHFPETPLAPCNFPPHLTQNTNVDLSPVNVW